MPAKSSPQAAGGYSTAVSSTASAAAAAAVLLLVVSSASPSYAGHSPAPLVQFASACGGADGCRHNQHRRPYLAAAVSDGEALLPSAGHAPVGLTTAESAESSLIAPRTNLALLRDPSSSSPSPQEEEGAGVGAPRRLSMAGEGAQHEETPQHLAGGGSVVGCAHDDSQLRRMLYGTHRASHYSQGSSGSSSAAPSDSSGVDDASGGSGGGIVFDVPPIAFASDGHSQRTDATAASVSAALAEGYARGERIVELGRRRPSSTDSSSPSPSSSSASASHRRHHDSAHQSALPPPPEVHDDGRSSSSTSSAATAAVAAAAGPAEQYTMLASPQNYADGHEADTAVSVSVEVEDRHTHRFQRSFSPSASASSTSSPYANMNNTAPIRIVFRTADIDDPSRYCGSVGMMAPDYMQGLVQCDEANVLTPKRKALLTDVILPRAAAVLEKFIRVVPIKGNLAVPMSPYLCGGMYTIPARDKAVGVPYADLVVYVSAGPTTSGIVAFAGMCSTDYKGRPITALANFGPRYLDAATEKDIDRVVRVVIHEMGHLLGFSGPYLESIAGILGSSSTSASSLVSMGVVRRGKSRNLFQGPNALAAARQSFQCPSLDGVELEDQNEVDHVGSHWERTYHMEDVMAAIVGDVMTYSPLTFGLLEDTGHYVIDNKNELETTYYMRNFGCAAFQDSCPKPNPSDFGGGGPSYFCSFSIQNECTYDYTSIGTCSFWSETSLTDSCRMVSPISNRRCNYYSNTAANNTNVGLYFGSDGRCFKTTSTLYKGGTANNGPARCLKSRCPFGSRVEFQVGDSNAWVQCPLDGSAGTVSAPSPYTGQIECPLATRFCRADLYYEPPTTAPKATTTTTTTTKATTTAATKATTAPTTRAEATATTTTAEDPTTATTHSAEVVPQTNATTTSSATTVSANATLTDETADATTPSGSSMDHSTANVSSTADPHPSLSSTIPTQQHNGTQQHADEEMVNANATTTVGGEASPSVAPEFTLSSAATEEDSDSDEDEQQPHFSNSTHFFTTTAGSGLPLSTASTVSADGTTTSATAAGSLTWTPSNNDTFAVNDSLPAEKSSGRSPITAGDKEPGHAMRPQEEEAESQANAEAHQLQQGQQQQLVGGGGGTGDDAVAGMDAQEAPPIHKAVSSADSPPIPLLTARAALLLLPVVCLLWLSVAAAHCLPG